MIHERYLAKESLIAENTRGESSSPQHKYLKYHINQKSITQIPHLEKEGKQGEKNLLPNSEDEAVARAQKGGDKFTMVHERYLEKQNLIAENARGKKPSLQHKYLKYHIYYKNI